MLVLLLPAKCVQIQEMPFRLPRNLSSKSTSLVVRWRKFLIQTQQSRKFSFLIGYSDLDCLQSLGHSLRFWSLRPSLGQAVFQGWVVSMLVRKHHSVFCVLNQKLLSILRWCWLGLLLLRINRKSWAFQTTLECIFCNISRTSDIAAKLFSIWGNSIYFRHFEPCGIVVILHRMKWFYLGIQLVWLQSDTFQLSISILPGEYTWKLPECSR